MMTAASARGAVKCVARSSFGIQGTSDIES
jgi:hypothetical protein